MKEYAVEEGKKVNLQKLTSPPLSRKVYAQAHQSLPIACHDVIIEYQGGLLLVVRDNFPSKGILGVIGGRISRGIPIKDSLQKKVKEECGLEINDIVELGTARTLFKTDPFGHGKGTDTINILFFARGNGKIKLDTLHKKPTIVKPADYTSKFRKSLHPYVRDLMDEGMKIIRKK
ncbi:MAG: NUDIX domain-containing protein [Nanoarchaeota archaeon]|nr:NUDIX domain-containing protein [Nanoarchaeota archaeon]